MQRRQQNLGSPSTPAPGPSRGAPPLLRSPFFSTSFAAAASTAAVSEQSSVSLDEWWLARVEGHERKIAVGGFFEKNQVAMEFTSAPIAKCYDLCTLKTEDEIIVFLHGFFNSERTLENGFTVEACEKFCAGFPHWWEKWNVLYPKTVSSQAGYQPSSSVGSNSREDSNVPSASMAECTNDEGQVGIDSASHINKGCQKTHVASLKSKLQCISLHDNAVPSEATDKQPSEKSVGPSRKKKESNIICPSPYDKQSRLTRGTLKSYSLSTPESLQLKRSRSGRVIVPPLDPGCQNIVYSPDGSVSAIAGLDSAPPLTQGSTLKYYARKKKAD